jgi:hypothetical protein
MINKKMQNLCKIGYTYKEVLMRAKELWTTGCPYPFDVIFCIKVKNPHKYELLIHNKLNNYRTHKSREFFECNPVEIISYFKMENLITYNEDKLDFHRPYLILYETELKNEIKNELIKENINESMDEIISHENNINTDNENNINEYMDEIIPHENNKNTICDKCDKGFNFNYLLKRHQNGKKPCIRDESLIIKYDNKINNIDSKILELTEQSIKTKKTCMFCNKNFNNKNNVERHIFSSCIIKKEMIINKNNIIKEKEKLVEDKIKIKLQTETNKIRNEIQLLRKIVEDIMVNK